jgi:hypothetical protein
MLNIKLLKEIQSDLDRRAREEFDSQIRKYVQKDFIQFLKTQFIQEELIASKTRIEIKQSSRVINNWEKEGVINKDITSEGKWRKFSKVDAVWINIVTELREFGLSLEKIKTVKSQLFDVTVKTFTPLEYAIIYTIIAEPILLIVYSDGKISLMPESAYKSSLGNKTISSHIYLNLLAFIEKEFPKANFHTIGIGNDYSLTEKELKLLYYLRTGDFDHIKVTLKNGEIYLLESERKVSISTKITDLIKKGDFQNIEVKTESGRIVHISQKEKIKL